MPFPTLQTWFAKKRSAATSPSPPKDRSGIRVGIPKVLNIWNTHQFWVGFLARNRNQLRKHRVQLGYLRGTGPRVRKRPRHRGLLLSRESMSGHYGELIFGLKKKVHIILSPMIYSLPSFLRGHVGETLACTRVMAGPENIKAGFMKESDVFADNGIKYASPFVSMAEPDVVPKQMYDGLKDVFDLDYAETQRAVEAGYKDLRAFNQKMRDASQGNSDLVRARRETVRPGAWPPISHGPRNRARDRIRPAGARLSDCVAAIPADR